MVLIIAFYSVILIFILFVWFALMYSFVLSLTHPPFVPTVNKKVVEKLSDYISKQKIDSVIEAGAGLCNVSMEIEKRHPEIKVTAIEYNLVIFLLAWLILKLKRSHIQLVRGDFLKIDLSKFQNEKSLIYCYLLPDLMEKAYKIGQLQNSDTITLDFKIPNLTPTGNILIGKTGFQKQLWIYSKAE